MSDHAAELRKWFGPHPATEAAIAEIARLRRDIEHLQAKAAGRDWWVSECAKSDEKCTQLTLENQKLRADCDRWINECFKSDSQRVKLFLENWKLRAKVNDIETARDAIIRFHNGPAEAKRPDVFVRLLKGLARALDEIEKLADGKSAIESPAELYSND